MKRCFLLFVLLALASIISIETSHHELGILLALISAVPCGIGLEISTRIRGVVK